MSEQLPDLLQLAKCNPIASDNLDTLHNECLESLRTASTQGLLSPPLAALLNQEAESPTLAILLEPQVIDRMLIGSSFADARESFSDDPMSNLPVPDEVADQLNALYVAISEGIRHQEALTEAEGEIWDHINDARRICENDSEAHHDSPGGLLSSIEGLLDRLNLINDTRIDCATKAIKFAMHLASNFFNDPRRALVVDFDSNDTDTWPKEFADAYELAVEDGQSSIDDFISKNGVDTNGLQNHELDENFVQGWIADNWVAPHLVKTILPLLPDAAVLVDVALERAALLSAAEAAGLDFRTEESSAELTLG